jgi:ribosomal protein S15P/S13E
MIEGEFRRGFEFLKNREDVPETVKTLFRLKHQKRREIVSFIRRKRNEGFQRNPLDEKSHEVQIANFTSKIRQQQEKIRYDNPNLVIFKSLISYYTNKRNRLLNELSRMDRERYRIVVEKLKISHKPSEPGVLDRPPIFRKDILTKLTKEYCDNIRQQRMTAYHDKLKSQQQDFLKERKETLEWIDNEMKKYHITEDDVRTEVRLRDKYRDPPNRRDPVSTI